MHLHSRASLVLAFLLALPCGLRARPSDERPVSVRYQLTLAMQARLLRVAHVRSHRWVANLRPYFEAYGMTFQPGTFATLDVRSHVLTVRNDAANRWLVVPFLESDLHATPRRLTTRSSEQAMAVSVSPYSTSVLAMACR